MDQKEAIQTLVDAAGDLTLECCEKCSYHQSEEFYKEQASKCRECHVTVMSDRATMAGSQLGCHWSPLQYEIRKHGGMWPNYIMPEDSDDEEATE